MSTDIFQKNYLTHQAHKKSVLTGEIKEHPVFKYTEKEKQSVIKVIKQRRSRRVYKKGIALKKIIEISKYAPSSCNRKAVTAKELPMKMFSMLVGAREWHKKGSVIGLFADMKAYKSPWEKDYMQFLDAGVMAQTILIYCEVMGYKACFINPNTHGRYKGKKVFCGAIAIGK